MGTMAVAMWFAFTAATSVIATECDLTGHYVMSNGRNIASKDNMTIVQTGSSFTVVCNSTEDHCSEAWGVGHGQLSPSFNSSSWDRKLSITYPAHKKHPKPYTLQGMAAFGEGCGGLKLYWKDNTVWCKGLSLGAHDCGGGHSPFTPPPPPPPPPNTANITKAYIVFSNHLDIGYTQNTNGSCAGAVVNQYFTTHFPKAIATGAALRNTSTRYRWMTQSWLVSMYRHCNESIINRFGGPKTDIHCPNASQLAAFEEAVKAGDITWHAFPHNAEPEMYDKDLFLSSLNITFEQDDYYGHARRMTLSQRDVPGLTRAVIPLLRQNGVRAVSVGENGACAPVNVPPIFVWRDNSTDTDVIAMFHPRGYGVSGKLTGDELDAMPEGIQSGAGPVGESDCVVVPAAGRALCFAWMGDNKGPHSPKDVGPVFNAVKSMFPRATVLASDAFDDFVADVLPYSSTLPVVTEEIGDTWIHGATSDPLKVAQFRAAQRARAACVASGQCDPSSSEMRTFDRLLMKVGEHTWGWNGGDVRTTAWSNDELAHAIKTDPQFSTSPWTWTEQRAFTTNAVAALPSASPLRATIEAAFADLVPTPFEAAGFTPAANPTAIIPIGSGGGVRFDPTGAITHLQALGAAGGTVWATDSNPIFRLWYHGMDADYFNDFTSNYNIKKAQNFGKPGLNLPSISSNFTVTQVLTKSSNWAAVPGAVEVLLRLRIANATAHESRGAPATAEALYLFDASKGDGRLVVNVTVQWFNKTMTHVPETIWMSHVPPVTLSRGEWRMDKLGSQINALDADLRRGGQCNPEGTTCGVHLHAVGDGGVTYSGPQGSMTLRSVDSALMSVGSATPVPTPLTVPDPLGGMHFALVGNIWNTNYPFWYPFLEEDAASRFRFSAVIGGP